MESAHNKVYLSPRVSNRAHGYYEEPRLSIEDEWGIIKNCRLVYVANSIETVLTGT